MFESLAAADGDVASPDDLGVAGLADALVAVREAQAELEARRWALVAQWAVAHERPARGGQTGPGCRGARRGAGDAVWR
jgi:hypothetical protein